MSRTSVGTIPDDRIIAKPAKKIDASDRAVQQSMSQRMKQKFDEEPKENVRIREEDGTQFVQINGYSYRIFPSDNYVKVPRSIAEELRNRGVI